MRTANDDSIKNDGLWANHVFFFQALDAFLSMNSFDKFDSLKYDKWFIR